MKQLFVFTIVFCFASAKAQNIIVQNGASFVASASPTIVLNNAALDAAANTLDWKDVNLIVSGNANCQLKTSSLVLQKLTVDKPNATLSLGSDVQVSKGVQMVNGLLDLSGKNLYLLSNSVITGETETTRITGKSGGTIQTTVNLSNVSNFNPGNLGVYVTTTATTGTVTVTRGHKPQTGTGLSSGIDRYYEFAPANTALNATLKFTYLDSELSGQMEAGLHLFESTNSGSSWNNKVTQTKSAADNYVTVTGLKSLYRYTLGAVAGTPLPVTQLNFSTKRLSPQQVQLDWKTAQETANKGFAIERKRENDGVFVQTAFVASKAPGGNSAALLEYTATDTNLFSGKTLYRLRQMDVQGTSTYSAIQSVDGAGKTASLSVWPQPAIGFVHLAVEGISKDELQIWNTGGQLLKQQQVTNNEVLNLQLPAGSYVVRLASQSGLVRKIVVQ